MKAKFLLILVLALGLGITSTNAQISQRAVNQHQRIKQGVKRGELTRTEAKNLRSNERATRRDIRSAKSDGKITPAERKDIKKDERKSSRKIYRKKHNARQRK